MNKYWMIALALLVFTAGCGYQETPERAAQDALQDQKVRAALAKQKRGSMSMPGELTPGSEDTKGSEASKKTETPEDSSAPDDTETSEEAETPSNPETPEGDENDKKGEDTTKDTTKDTAASPKVDAQQVFDDAVAAAKADNKALFVHFTADW